MKHREAVDVVVVGAGPAGLSAAIAATRAGKRVLVLDQSPRPGGQIWRHRDAAQLPRDARWMLESARTSGVRFAPGARVIDVFSPSELLVDFSGRVDRVRTRALIIATGAKERFLPFPGWTLPGVVGVGGLQALLKSGVSLSGARVVIAGTGPLLFPVAAAVARSGADVAIVAEQAAFSSLAQFSLALLGKPAAIWQGLKYRSQFLGSRFATGSWVTRADGHGRLQRASIAMNGTVRELECDWLAASAGLIPNVELALVSGCHMSNEAVDVDHLQATSVPGIWAAGECTGVKGDAAAIAEGAIAGCAAAGDTHGAMRGSLQRRRRAGRKFAASISSAFAIRPELLELAEPDTIICRCEDVRRNEIDPAWSQRQAKLWTRVGMGECQGAVCGPACAALFNWQQNIPRTPLGAPLCGDWAEQLNP